jgi:hypothetical protein
MAWLTRKKSVVEAEPVVVDAVSTAAATATALPLGVLVPDSGGISSFQLTMHPDTASAEAQIGALRADVRRGTYAFWAMHERPAVDDTMHVEAIVLIRAKPDDDIVYVVSFLDIESALSFTRFELRRGLHIRNVMIYWAAFTQVREELEGVSIIPTTAPPTISEALLLSPDDPRLAPLPPPAPEASVSVAEPEPETASTVQSEAREAVERYLRQNPDKAAAAPVAEQPAVVEDSLAVAEPPVVAEPPAVEEPEIDEEPWPPAKVVRTPRIVHEPHAVEKAAIEEALVLQHPPVAEPVAEPEPPEATKREPAEWTPKRRWAVRDKRQRAEQPETAEEPAEVAAEPIAAELIVAEPAVAEPIVSEPGDEEAEWEEALATGAAVDPAEGFPPNHKYDEFDIALEVEQLLKNRKWETRNGPFSGFKSPPGRF